MLAESGWPLLPMILIAAVVLVVLFALLIVVTRFTDSSYTRDMRGWGYHRHEPSRSTNHRYLHKRRPGEC
ncbi:hypothetical protein JXM67_11195 [candidate division WOR-3 bacterium]|nr:hypothetical protein [candidate division WOR-3 bacterium]